MIKAGDRIGELNFTDSVGNSYSLKTFSDKKAIAFFFYPMDFTRICTEQACYFRDFYSEITALGGVLFGISLDDDKKHRAFAGKYKLPYPLIDDKGKKISQKLKTLKWHRLFNKRVTVILKPDGTVLEVIHDEKNAQIHSDRFVSILKSL